MSDKPFSLGIIVGRFQTLHSGHEFMIRTAISLCDRVAVFVGSSQESGTAANPFPYSMRESLLRILFADSIEVYPLPDIGVGNNASWGSYVLEKVRDNCGRNPDLLVSGKEARRVSWFDEAQGVPISELYLPKTIEISATQMRSFFLNDDRESWQKFTNPAIWDQYDTLRQYILVSCNNMDTASL